MYDNSILRKIFFIQQYWGFQTLWTMLLMANLQWLQYTPSDPKKIVLSCYSDVQFRAFHNSIFGHILPSYVVHINDVKQINADQMFFLTLKGAILYFQSTISKMSHI